MQGRRDPQQSYFDAHRMPHSVPPDSFYSRLGEVIDVLFTGDDLAMMYSPDTGRPSLPPSLMAGIMILQFYCDVSDARAVECAMFDRRWQVALHLPLDYRGFDRSSLSYFRKRLVDHGQERFAFDRLVEVGREAGFLPDRVTLLTDTTDVKGAGAVQDTYTLLRKAIRKALRAAHYHLPGKRQRLSAEARALVERYVDRDRRADIDWSDPQERAAELKRLVDDADAALETIAEQMDDPDVRSIGWVLTKILGDDVVTGEGGDPQIGEGTAPDRIISVTDPEMRHGRKSKSKRINGFKAIASMDQGSELLLDIADMTAMGSDGAELMEVIGRIEARTGVRVDRVIADGAFGSGKNRAGCAEYGPHPVDLVSPLRRPYDPEVDKSAFQIDLEAGSCTCPRGHTVGGRPRPYRDGQPVLAFTFPREVCESCPLFGRCVKSKSHGRTVTTHPQEAHLQSARQRQETEAFHLLYLLRVAVERKIAELVWHGLRHTRYIGEAKRQLQRLWQGAGVNLRRLFTLAQERSVDLRQTITGSRQRHRCPATA